ncbi:hypothetical protein XCCB100_3723 [Xanthomonas campestris pv. campestris]|uniref:Uncharacterized protein n=1 Tax=Xanthomonas campestris pv. campestris (strain B100) TaxID=509169 RepID=B0RVJ9_XANCB|nr:hypothetical protein XCCB100_3723 [Xanthomonas campestris pv. campestris]
MVGVHGCSNARRASNSPASVFCELCPQANASREMTGFHLGTDKLSGAVSSPIAGPCDGMDAATERTWTYLRRVPRGVRKPRPRPTQRLTFTSDCIQQDAADTKTALTEGDRSPCFVSRSYR